MTLRCLLQLEELGARFLPSATPLHSFAPPAPPALLSATQPIAHFALHGHASGGYTAAEVQAGVGIEYHLHGAGTFAALGRVTVSGSFHSVGFVLHGRAQGTLTLTNARGRVRVSLEGPVQDGFSPLPQQFSYRVVGGTGAYAHLSGQGHLSLVLQAQPTGDLPGPHGTFTLSA